MTLGYWLMAGNFYLNIYHLAPTYMRINTIIMQKVHKTVQQPQQTTTNIRQYWTLCEPFNDHSGAYQYGLTVADVTEQLRKRPSIFQKFLNTSEDFKICS